MIGYSYSAHLARRGILARDRIQRRLYQDKLDIAVKNGDLLAIERLQTKIASVWCDLSAIAMYKRSLQNVRA